MNRIFSSKRTLFFVFFLLLVGGTTAVFLLSQRNQPTETAVLAQTYICDDQSMNAAQIADHRGISLDMLILLNQQRGLTPPEICVMPEAKLERAIKKANEPKPDHPDEAIAWRQLQLQDENGYIPPDGYATAAEQMAQMAAEQAKNQIEIDSSDWTSLGPGNVGGRVRAILIDPNNPDKMWAGSVGGGLWTTTNSGTSWQPVNDFMANLAVASLVMDPSNSNVMYAGTGEGFYNADALRGAGVFKSTDGGSTWTQLSNTANSNWYWVNRLSIHPTNSQILLAATGSGIWRSTNGGSSWTRTSTDSGIKDIDFNPTNGNLAVASGSYGRAYYSTNGGSSWTASTGWSASGWLERVEVAYAPSNTNIVYASININGGELWRSANGGQSYTLMNSGNSYLGGQGWYDNIIWVDPTNANMVIVGGIDLWRSSNGGSSLSKISQWWSAPYSAHADHHAIVSHPDFNGTTNRIVYFGNDGGVYRANDVYTVAGTSGWQELNNNLGITQFYGAAGNPETGVIVGGTQDNGTLLYTGNAEGWTTMYGGDGGFSAADPTDPNYFYGEYVFLQIHRSTNGGASSSYIYSGIGDAGNCANFIAPFILDPNNANRLLAGGCSLWRSNNVKAYTPSWTAIKPSVGSNISAIAVAEGNSDVVWVGHNNGEVYRTTNGTAVSPTWTRMDNTSPNLPNRYVTRIAIDPQNSNSVYVTFSGFTDSNIWHTSNGGSTWQDVSGSGATSLPYAPVRSLIVHPENSNELYAGTEVGVFVSEDGGSTWILPHSGPANVSVDELFLVNDQLVAATHGRGLFSAQITICLDTLEDNDSAGTATAVSLGSTITGANICGANDVDYYAFNGQANEKIFLNIDAQTLGSALDSYIYLIDSDGTTTLAQNDDEQTGILDSKLGYTLPHDGTYYVMVRDYNYPNEGDQSYFYTLQIDRDETNPATAEITAPQENAWIDPTQQTITAVATDNESGVQRVEFLWHDDDWTVADWVHLGSDTDGRDGWQLNFDSNSQPELQGGAFYIWAFDWTNNWTGYGVGGLGIDRTPPVVSATTSQLYTDAPFRDFNVIWDNGTDNLSGITSYDVQSRDGTEGQWTTIATNTTGTNQRFVGDVGHTYYFRARAHDAAGNISSYAGGDGDASYTVVVCDVTEDTFESDNSYNQAPLMATNGITQTHNFHTEGDEDWVQFYATANLTYTLITTNTGGHADTQLYIYDTDGTTELAYNDDDIWPASRIDWQPPVNGIYYAKVDHFDPWAYGCTTEYGWSIHTNDHESPNGQVEINNDDTYTNNRDVILDLNATDAGTGVYQVAISNNGIFTETDWTTYQNNLPWTLTAGEGTKTIFVKFRDRANNESAIVQDTIILDTTPPTGNIVIANGAPIVTTDAVSLALTATDQNGVTHMRLREADENWQSWQPFSPVTNWTLADFNGNHTVQVQFRDTAENVSSIFQDEVFYKRDSYIYLPLLTK